LTRLANEAGIENPTDEDLRRFDKNRPDKKVSNEEWQSPTNPDSRIAKMKDGTTHLAYKEALVDDLDGEFVLSATITPTNHSDAETMVDSVAQAQPIAALINQGGTFAPARVFSLGFVPPGFSQSVDRLELADLNGDLFADLVVHHFQGDQLRRFESRRFSPNG